MGFPSKKHQFTKGASGNPGGSSRRQRLTNALIAVMDEKSADRAFVQVGLKAALGGDFRFWAYLFERIDGPPQAAHEDDRDEKPRIKIPGAPGNEGRPKAARKPRTRKPPT